VTDVRLDPERRAEAQARADALRAEAGEAKARWLALIDQARMIENSWRLPAPCHLCGRRDCNH
jgi:hypothetical protein